MLYSVAIITFSAISVYLTCAEPPDSHLNVASATNKGITTSNLKTNNVGNGTSTMLTGANVTGVLSDRREPTFRAPDDDLQITTGALIRGFVVFAGLGIAMLIYLGYKTLTAHEPPAPDGTVKLYGVVAKRNDLEMRPLPLDDEDDMDDMIFDRGSLRGGVS